MPQIYSHEKKTLIKIASPLKDFNCVIHARIFIYWFSYLCGYDWGNKDSESRRGKRFSEASTGLAQLVDKGVTEALARHIAVFSQKRCLTQYTGLNGEHARPYGSGNAKYQ